ncbi:MAG: hypothetical protein AB4372_30845 [Xenococcus sp. (in: cyanobacteria)]
MPTKKKLSTRPIKIEVPSVEATGLLDSTLPDSLTEESKIEEVKQVSLKQENSLPAFQKLDSEHFYFSFSIKPVSVKPDSQKLETTLPETNLRDSNNLDSNTDSNPESLKPVSGKPDSITTYKKVSMRVSQESYERLREFRGETGIPYEILVDVMVRNWDSLPKRTQNAYLKESQQVRAQRLIAGQQKAMLTTQQKYSQL